MRKFGVEIEFGGNRQAVLEELNREGLAQGTSIHSYLGHSNTHWVVKSDASVQGGGELVGPPLDFDDEDQRNQLTKAVQCLQRAGATTDERAGIHIHIDSRGMTPKQVAAVARLFIKYEDVLYRLGSSGWRRIRPGAGTYARPLSESQKSALPRVKDERQLRRAYYGYSAGAWAGHSDRSRNCGLNLNSHFYRGTIEWRLFNSSLNPTRIQTYVAVCMALVQDAKNGTIRSVNKSVKLGDMSYGNADPDKVLYNFLAVVRYKAGMSVEDYRNVKRIWKDSVPQDGNMAGNYYGGQ